MFKSLDIDTNITTISPIVIHNLINGQQGLIYGNILSMLLAFNVYKYINSGSNLSALYELLENKNYSYKKNLINFISAYNDDYYNIFITECLKIKNTIVENYFDDVEQTEVEK